MNLLRSKVSPDVIPDDKGGHLRKRRMQVPIFPKGEYTSFCCLNGFKAEDETTSGFDAK